MAKNRHERHGISGSKIFENYTAQIKERSIKENGDFLTVPLAQEERRSSLTELDPDLGDSSRFNRRCLARSTWNGRSIQDAHAKKKSHALRKIGKLFGK